MKLKKLFLELLQEEELDDVIKFPAQNLVVSIFRSDKRMMLMPQDKGDSTLARSYVNMLKQQFRVYDVNHLSGNVFEVIFDPREDFESVVEYIRNQVDKATGGF